MTRRSLLFSLIGLLAVFTAGAQIQEPIKWTEEVKMTSATDGVLTLRAAIDPGWHLYGFDIPDGGPKSTTITLNDVSGVKWIGEPTPSVKPIEKVDMIFHMKLSWWENSVTFTQRFKLDGVSGANITGTISFMGCNDTQCLSPSKYAIDVAAGNVTEAIPAVDTAKAVPAPVAPKTETATAGNADLWAKVELTDAGEEVNVSDASWWHIFIWGFIGGLLALLTPCVWPMIPMTVSFFLKRTDNRAKSIRDAIIYGIAIIVIYLVLGLAITLIFGASKLNDLSTNAVFNLAFFALLVVFGISFLGAFDITLPSKWSNKTDGKAERTAGLISIFFMAFTLVLVSFSCTGPIIGTLLVEAVSLGNLTGPAIGMGGFALALALPFTLFAVFPSWLKTMPKSGGWLNSVKVVLGFLELALSLKFLSVADLAYGWGILDREVFVSLWIVLFVLLGFYLLGKIRFSHDSPVDHVSVPRFFLATVSLSFAVYLVPGLWGAPLKGISAFAPPLYTQDFNLYEGGQFEHFEDYDKGMEYAAKNNLPVLMDFSGYGCVNCRKMEGAVFDTPEVSSIIKENFVLITLMVDDKKPLDKPMVVEENGKKVTLETVGDKWSYLQRHKFAANSQPYYMVLDNEGKAMTPPAYYDENIDKFVNWLNGGIKKYSENKK